MAGEPRERIAADVLQDQNARDLLASGVPVGTVVAWPGENAPDGWHVCDGTPIAGKNWSKKLTEVLPDETYKGRLPDYRGLFLRGVANERKIVDYLVDPGEDRRRDHDFNTQDRGGVGSTQHHMATLYSEDDLAEHYKYKKYGEEVILRYSTVLLAGGGTYEGMVRRKDCAGDPNLAETRPINVYVNWIIKVR